MAVRTISPGEVHALIAQGGPVDLIDVRTGLEFNAVHAVGARHAPLSALDPAAVLAGRRAGKDQPLYIICKSGGRSAAACAAFQAAGFANVFSVAGGTDAWAAAGLPVERGPGAGMLGAIRALAILVVVAAAAALLLPCSPWTVLGSPSCPAAVAK